MAAVTAAVAVIAGGGYGVAQLLTGSPAVTGAASGTGSAAPNIKVKGPVPGPSAGGLNQAPASGSGSGGGGRSSASTMAPLVLRSGTNYQLTSLGAQASAVLAQLSLSSPASPHPIPTVAPAQDQARLFPNLQACLIRVGHGQRPLLVDLARYRGHPALIVVLPGANGAQRQALAIAPGCDILASAPLPASG